MWYIFLSHPVVLQVLVVDLYDDKAPALEIWGMWSTPSLPLLPVLVWLKVVAPDRVLSMNQIEQTGCKQMTDVK